MYDSLLACIADIYLPLNSLLQQGYIHMIGTSLGRWLWSLSKALSLASTLRLRSSGPPQIDTKMNVPFNPPAPISGLTPELTAAVKERVENNLSSLLDKLSKTVFYKKSSALAAVRDAGDPSLVNDDGQLLQRFYRDMPFTSYDDYSSYVSRFFTQPCLQSDVGDLLAPGLPVFLAHTSGTSGSAPKYFPKYPNPLYAPSPWNSPDAPRISMCGFNAIRLNKLVEIVDDNGQVVEDLPVTNVSNGGMRQYLGIGPKDDEKIIDEKGLHSFRFLTAI